MTKSTAVSITVGAQGPSTAILTLAATTTTGVVISPGLDMNLTPADTLGNTNIFTPGTFTLLSGTNYTLTAENFAPYTFQKWSDNSSTNPVRTVNITTATTYTAIYTTATAVITLTATTTTTIASGGMVTFTANDTLGGAAVVGKQLYYFENGATSGGVALPSVTDSNGNATFSVTFTNTGSTSEVVTVNVADDTTNT